MNNLARLDKVKGDIAGVNSTSALDAALVRSVDEVSREFETSTRRSFVARSGTRYLCRHPRACPDELRLFDDLASITSVLVDYDGDGTYELTLAENTDYFVEREDDLDPNTPIACLRLNPNGTQIAQWPSMNRSIKVTGLWGYSYELQATGLTLQGGGINASALTATLSASAQALVFPGDVLVLDSEQFDVSVVNGTGVTFGQRALNGTAAANHAVGTTAYVRRYPRDVERAIAERVVGLRWDSQGGYDAGVTLIGEQMGAAGKTTIRGSFARWQSTVKRYKNWEVA